MITDLRMYGDAFCKLKQKFVVLFIAVSYFPGSKPASGWELWKSWFR